MRSFKTPFRSLERQLKKQKRDTRPPLYDKPYSSFQPFGGYSTPPLMFGAIGSMFANTNSAPWFVASRPMFGSSDSEQFSKDGTNHTLYKSKGKAPPISIYQPKKT